MVGGARRHERAQRANRLARCRGASSGRRVLDQLRAARAEIGLKSTSVTLPNGTPVATITLIDPAPAVVVTDDGAFADWTARHYPGEVATRVRPSWQKAFLSRLDPTAHPVADPHTGVPVAGLAAVPA